MNKIQISILNQGTMRVELNNLLLKMFTENKEYELHIEYPNLKPIQANRNDIVNRFLKTDRDYLLMIDGDIVPKKNPLDLIKYDKDVIGLLCPTFKNTEMIWLAMDKTKNGWTMSKKLNDEGLIEIDAIGTGCILIKRRVLEKIKAPFNVIWNDDGTMDTGLDFAFCDKCKKENFKIYFHSDYFCSHFMNFDFLNVALQGRK